MKESFRYPAEKHLLGYNVNAGRLMHGKSQGTEKQGWMAGMIRMTHQQSAKSRLSFPHTLKNIIMMQDKEMFDPLGKETQTWLV